MAQSYNCRGMFSRLVIGVRSSADLGRVAIVVQQSVKSSVNRADLKSSVNRADI